MDSSKQKVYKTVRDGIHATVVLFHREDGVLDCDVKVEIDEDGLKIKRTLPLLVSDVSET